MQALFSKKIGTLKSGSRLRPQWGYILGANEFAGAI
jgi:hypothetical protein